MWGWMLRGWSSFSEPDLTALKIDRGNLLETYVYKKKPGQNLAFIRLEGGRVVPPQ
jgi:hypothetical protein